MMSLCQRSQACAVLVLLALPAVDTVAISQEATDSSSAICPGTFASGEALPAAREVARGSQEPRGSCSPSTEPGGRSLLARAYLRRTRGLRSRRKGVAGKRTVAPRGAPGLARKAERPAPARRSRARTLATRSAAEIYRLGRASDFRFWIGNPAAPYERPSGFWICDFGFWIEARGFRPATGDS